MLREVKGEIIELATNLTFARNLSLSMIVAIVGLCGLAELQGQNRLVSQQDLITNVSNSSTTKVIINQ